MCVKLLLAVITLNNWNKSHNIIFRISSPFEKPLQKFTERKNKYVSLKYTTTFYAFFIFLNCCTVYPANGSKARQCAESLRPDIANSSTFITYNQTLVFLRHQLSKFWNEIGIYIYNQTDPGTSGKWLVLCISRRNLMQ